METTESIRISLNTGEWVSPIDLHDAYLHYPVHLRSSKYLRFPHSSQIYQFTSSVRASPGSSNVHYDNEGSKTHGPVKRNTDAPIFGRMVDQASHNTKVVVNLTKSLC